MWCNQAGSRQGRHSLEVLTVTLCAPLTCCPECFQQPRGWTVLGFHSKAETFLLRNDADLKVQQAPLLGPRSNGTSDQRLPQGLCPSSSSAQAAFHCSVAILVHVPLGARTTECLPRRLPAGFIRSAWIPVQHRPAFRKHSEPSGGGGLEGAVGGLPGPWEGPREQMRVSQPWWLGRGHCLPWPAVSAKMEHEVRRPWSGTVRICHLCAQADSPAHQIWLRGMECGGPWGRASRMP